MEEGRDEGRSERRSEWYRDSTERRAFLEARRDSGIGGSEIHDLLTGNALTVYHNHTRPIEHEDADESIHLLRGRVLEPFALEVFARMTGWVVRHEKQQVTHPDYPGASCSPDGTLFDPARTDEGSGEVKAPSWRVFRYLIEHGTRDEILWQVQHTLAVRRMLWGTLIFVTLEHSDGPLYHVDVEAQPDVGQFCLEVAAEFWRQHVIPRVPPDPWEWAKLREKAPRLADREPYGKQLVALDDDEEARALIAQRCTVDTVLRQAAFAKEDITDELDALLARAYPGQGRFEVSGLAKVTRVQTKTAGGFDKSLLVEHRPVDRDALVRYLMDEHGFEVEKAEGVAEMLRLDLGHFQRPGRPYEFLKVTPADVTSITHDANDDDEE